MIAAAIPAVEAGAETGRPNFVIILTDDAGYSDPGCYGGEMSTPNIDALAAGGIRFAKFYTNARCSPTRASLMTGMYPHRVGVGDLCMRHNETPFPGYKRAMSKDVVTLPEALRAAGYHTLMSGKWHLGGRFDDDADRRPLARGFDRHFGKLGGGNTQFEPSLFRLDGAPYTRGPEEYGDDFYTTRAITDYAVRFLRQAREQDRRPFFLYVAYTAPHKPYQVPEADLRRHQGLYEGGVWEPVRAARTRRLRSQGLIDRRWRHTPLTSEQRARFDRRGWAIDEMRRVAAMTAVVDEGVGRIVDALRELGELERTLIVYLSDNGPDGFHSFVGATPLTGAKNRLTEGGIATHGIFHWPGGIRKPGRIERRPGHVIDLMPTLLELAGARVEGGQRLDGRSLVPVLEGRRWRGHETLFWELYSQQAMIRKGRWKYLADADGTARLYDLRADPAETVDLAARNPRRMRDLAASYQRWADANNVMPPGVVERWHRERKQKAK